MGKFKHPKVIEAKLGQEKADGIMDYEDGVIYIDERLRGRRKIDTLLHERLHAKYPDWPEKKVATLAAMLADFLWINHVRPVDNKLE